MEHTNFPSHKLIHSPNERNTMDRAEKVEHRLSTHEEVCALRYEGINARLARLEKILVAFTGAVLVLLLKLVLNV